MGIFASYYTDKGIVKQVNQDSLSVKIVNSPKGKIVFALVCDGMGGLSQGEVASKEVVIAFNNWFATRFSDMVMGDCFSKEVLYEQWQEIAESLNDKLDRYANNRDMMMGTTVSALLIYMDHYYICHVGDSRIYRIDSKVQQITMDHTLVAQEVRLGMLTEEEAENDPRRSVLLQCIGASSIIEPQFTEGKVEGEATFLLCSDGFVHKNSDNDLQRVFAPANIKNKEHGNELCKEMVFHAMEQDERDNISVVIVVVK